MSTLLNQVLSRRLYRTGLIIAIGIVTVVGILISFNTTLSNSLRGSGYDYLRKELIEARSRAPNAHPTPSEVQGEPNQASYKRGTCRSSAWGPEWVVDSNGGVCKHGQVERSGCCSAASTVPSVTSPSLPPRQLDGMRSPLTISADNTPNQPSDEARDPNSASTHLPNIHQIDTTTLRESQMGTPTCSTEHQCCEQYEYCVSRCLEFTWDRLHSTVIHAKKSDSEDAEKSFDSIMRLLGDHQAEDANVANEYSAPLDIFDWCLLRCRTSGRSIVHQNSFRSTLKHCYGTKDPPLLARHVEDGESQ